MSLREHGRVPLPTIPKQGHESTFPGALLDNRVRSSVGTQSVYFPPYSAGEMPAILRNRLRAFKADAVSYHTLSACAALAASEHGDARRALDLLRTVGELAARAGSSLVEIGNVDRAEQIVDAERASRVIWDLPAQEVVVLMALNYLQWDGREEAVTTEALYGKYQEECGFWGLPERAKRRFLDFLQDLEIHGLIGLKVRISGQDRQRFHRPWRDGGTSSGCLVPESSGPDMVAEAMAKHLGN